MSTREIKFRGKRKDNNEWIYGDLYQEKKPYTKTNEIKEVMIVEYRPDLCLVSGAPNYNHWWREIIPETIGQFTGLKDKKGADIYEGDIIKDNNDIIIVLWNDKYAGFTLHCENWACLAFFYEYLDVKNVEVIGNIHDNPELLNK